MANTNNNPNSRNWWYVFAAAIGNVVAVSAAAHSPKTAGQLAGCHNLKCNDDGDDGEIRKNSSPNISYNPQWPIKKYFEKRQLQEKSSEQIIRKQKLFILAPPPMKFGDCLLFRLANLFESILPHCNCLPQCSTSIWYFGWWRLSSLLLVVALI